MRSEKEKKNFSFHNFLARAQIVSLTQLSDTECDFITFPRQPQKFTLFKTFLFGRKKKFFFLNQRFEVFKILDLENRKKSRD